MSIEKDKDTKELAKEIVNAWNQPLENESDEEFKERIATSVSNASRLDQFFGAIKTDTSSYSVGAGGSSSDVVTVTITPQSSSSKILIFATLIRE